MKEMGPSRSEICKIVSEMLDNPDKDGIYPTTRCYEQLDALIERQEEFWRSGIKDDAERAGINTQGMTGMAILHVMADKLLGLPTPNDP